MFVVLHVLLKMFSLGVVRYVVCMCKGCDGCCALCLNCESWCSHMVIMSVSSCKCFMLVSCVHIVAVLIAAFCMTCTLFMLYDLHFVYAGRGCKEGSYGIWPPSIGEGLC